mgnify:CR=1 FL=1
MDPFLHSPAEKPSMGRRTWQKKNPSRSKRPTSDSEWLRGWTPPQRKVSSKRKSDLLSPVKTTAKYGGKAIYKTASIIIRFVSLLLIAGTAAFLAYNFWRGSAPYGDPVTAVEERIIVWRLCRSRRIFSFIWMHLLFMGYDTGSCPWRQKDL